MDISNINNKLVCRICLGEGNEYVSLFEDDLEDDIKIYSKIMACSTVQITETDGYPSNICPLCYSMLDTAYKFKVKCEDTDTKLRTCITKHCVKVELDDFLVDDYNGDASHDFDDFPPVNIKEEIVNENNVESLLVEKQISKVRKKNTKKKKKTKWKVTKSEKVLKTKIEKPKQKIIPNSKSRTKVKTNPIASSLLEGKCMWNGFNWRFISQPINSQEEIKARKEADKIRIIIEEERIKISKERSNKKKQKFKKEHPDKVPTTLCDMCGKTFTTKHHMRVHHRTVHHGSSSILYKCPDLNCNKEFKLQDYLNKHVKRCHGEKRQYICNDCGKQFSFITSLRNHIKIHTGDINWKSCPYCSQKYKTQKSVDIHIKSAHTGERPHACTMCDSAFFHVDYLKEHMRLHTGETPYKCPICKRGYAQRGNMKSHMKQHRLSELSEQLRATMKPNYLRLLRDC